MSTDEHALYDRAEPDLSGWEHELYDSVRRDEPWELVAELSGLRRISPSADERRAAALVEERLDDHGVPYERYDPELWLSVPHGASVRAIDSGGDDATWSGSDDEFEEERPEVKALAFSAPGTVRGEVAFLGMGRPDDESEAFEELSLDAGGVDLEGKVVLADTVTVSKRFFKDVRDAGAAALVMIHPFDEPMTTTCSWIWGAIPHPDRRDLVPDIPYVTVSERVGDRLRERVEGSDAPVEFEVTTDLTRTWADCPLVLARIPGEADPDEDGFVLLHGHLDSWYHGATDNATGDAGMVECARILNEHREAFDRDLWIGWWPGHEGGRYGGSSWFVDRFGTDLVERCVAHVNMDSPGVGDATEFLTRVKWMPSLHGLSASAIDDVCGKPTEEHRPARAGDYAFNNLGIPGTSLQSSIPADVREERGYYPIGGSGGNTDAWHRSTDTVGKADPDVLRRDIRVYLVALARLLSDPVLPIDHRRTVARHRETVAGYDEAAGERFDLSPVLEELDALAEALEAFHDAVAAGELSPRAANEAAVAVSRRLVAVDFASEGRFEQDPGMYRPAYPLLEPAARLPDLDGDEYRFARTHLRRGRNRVVDELRRAREALPTR